MKLVHPILGKQIEFAENTINVISIENKQFFNQIIRQLLQQIKGEEGDFVLSLQAKELSMAKSCDLLIDFFNIDINSRKNLTKIYVLLTQQAQMAENYLATNSLVSSILTYMENLLFNQDLNLTYKEDFEINALLKALDIKLEFSFGESLLEQIKKYLDVSAQLTDIKVFIFVNLKLFLADDELADLYKFIAYNKYNILLLESVKHSTTHARENNLIIDKDLCEIY